MFSPSLFLFLFLNYFLVGLVYSVIFYFLLKGNHKFALRLLFMLLLVWGISFLIKSLFYFPRPYIALGIEPLFHSPKDGTFPSGHTATTFVVAFAVFRKHRRLGFNLLVISSIVAATRVAYSFHSWIDVLGGIILAKTIDSWQSS